MALAGTKLRSWCSRLDAAQRKIEAVMDEIDGSNAAADAKLKERLKDADCYLADCLSILAATIEICRDPRGARPADTQIIVAELTWNDELWVECGRERIEIDKAMAECNSD